MQASAQWLSSAFRTIFWTSDGTFQGKFKRNNGLFYSPEAEKITDVWRLVDQRSQRENWYDKTRYISELWCALSNIGFIYVGAKHDSKALLIAGTASFFSHSVPKDLLLMADKAGVALVALTFAREYKVLTEHPWLLLPGAILGLISATDVYLARTRAHTWSHVVWHLSAAACADLFLRYAKG